MSDIPTGAEHFWFLDTLVSVRLPHTAGKDGITVLEHRVPAGDSPPLHLHRTEDEVFHVLEGRFRFLLNQEDRRVGPGETLLAPRGVPHTYRAESAEGGRYLTVTCRGHFERFVRAMGRRAERAALPPPAGAPTAEAIQALTTTALAHGIEIVGPPLH